MARTKQDDRMPDETAAQEYVDQLHNTPGAGTELEAARIEREQAAQDVIDGVVTDLTQAAAARAAEYVGRKKLGPSMTQIVMYVAAKAVDTAELNTVISEQLAVRILNAQSAADIFDPFGTTRDKDFVGKNLHCEGVMFLESDKAEGFPWYVALDVRDPQTGSLAPIIVGGEKLVPQVAGLDMHDAWPQTIRIESTRTRGGFDVYGLVPPMPY